VDKIQTEQHYPPRVHSLPTPRNNFEAQVSNVFLKLTLKKNPLVGSKDKSFHVEKQAALRQPRLYLLCAFPQIPSSLFSPEPEAAGEKPNLLIC
jgi:hypothetical protein